MAQQLPEDAVGRRVSCDGERGTVRYVGTVPPTTGGPDIQQCMSLKKHWLLKCLYNDNNMILLTLILITRQNEINIPLIYKLKVGVAEI